MTYNNINHLYTIVNHELDNLTDWFRANKLSLNISKTNYMLFSHLNKELINTEIKLANTTIPKTKCVKFLGLLIDENLKWDEHIQYIKNKISGSFHAINKAKYVIPRKLSKNTLLLSGVSLLNVWHNIVGSHIPCAYVQINHNAEENYQNHCRSQIQCTLRTSI